MNLLLYNDVEAYAESLSRLMADESLRRDLGDGVRVAVCRKFTREIILRQWDEAVRRVRKGK